MEHGVFTFALVVMMIFFVALYHQLDDTFSSLKTSLYRNTCSALCDPYRPHVKAATLVWVGFKGLLMFGRPLQVFSSNMAVDNLHQWPQVVMVIFWWDFVLNSLWILQLAIGTIVPAMNPQHEFEYKTVVCLIPTDGSDNDVSKHEHFYVTVKHKAPMLSSFRCKEDTVNTIDCFVTKIEEQVQELALTTFPGFEIPVSSVGFLYHTNGTPTLLVGRESLKHVALNKADAERTRVAFLPATRRAAPLPATPSSAAPPPATPSSAAPPPATPSSAAPPPVIFASAAPLPVIFASAAPLPVIFASAPPLPATPPSAAPTSTNVWFMLWVLAELAGKTLQIAIRVIVLISRCAFHQLASVVRKRAPPSAAPVAPAGPVTLVPTRALLMTREKEARGAPHPMEIEVQPFQPGMYGSRYDESCHEHVWTVFSQPMQVRRRLPGTAAAAVPPHP